MIWLFFACTHTDIAFNITVDAIYFVIYFYLFQYITRANKELASADKSVNYMEALRAEKPAVVVVR